MTADLKTVFKQVLDLCEFNASIMNLLEPTGLPQMDQNSEFITCLTTFWKWLQLELDFGLGDGRLWMFLLVFWMGETMYVVD